MRQRSILSYLASEKAKQSSCFFTLPLEIRMKIYRLCVPSGALFDVREMPTFGAGWHFTNCPDALLNRPPCNAMCRHHFTNPGKDEDAQQLADFRNGQDNYLWEMGELDMECPHDCEHDKLDNEDQLYQYPSLRGITFQEFFETWKANRDGAMSDDDVFSDEEEEKEEEEGEGRRRRRRRQRGRM
ncbi:hypothetical protein NKR19_g10216, partial [Coniochaeta hoffmannii]